MRNRAWLFTLPVVVSAYFGACQSPGPAPGSEPGPDVLNWMRKADFVFEGEVVRVEYKNSLPLPASSRKNTVVNPLTDEVKAGLITRANRGVLVDSGEIPHTFVTYRVVQPFKGNFANTTEVTLRFVGGVNTHERITRINPETLTPEETYTITEVLTQPQIDVGDRDFVFAHRNGQKACPLADCEIGRFRVLQAPGDDRDYIFDEWGQEVHQLRDTREQARFHFPFERQIPEVLQHTMTLPNGEVRNFAIVNVEPEANTDLGETSSASREHSSPEENHHQPITRLPIDGDVIEQPSSATRITPEILTALLIQAADQLYPDGMSRQPEPVSVDIRDDFEVTYLRGEISEQAPVENDQPPSPPTPESVCDRVEAAVMAEALTVRGTAGGPIASDDADVLLTEDQVRRIQQACAGDVPVRGAE